MADEKPLRPLTQRQKLFVDHYANTRNGTKAAELAGYSPHTAGEKSYQLRNLPKYRHVQAALALKLAESRQNMAQIADLVIDTLVQVATFDKRGIFNEDGSFVGYHNLSFEDQGCIAEHNVKEYEGGKSVRLKYDNRQSALDKLAKIAGLYDNKKPETEASEAEMDAELESRLSSLRDEVVPDTSIDACFAVMPEEEPPAI